MSDNQVQAIILKCDGKARHTPQDTASGFSPIHSSMACHRLGASLVACHADPSGRSVDCPTANRGAHPAPLAGHHTPYNERYKFIPLSQMSLDL
jgi:hypothetical protein